MTREKRGPVKLLKRGFLTILTGLIINKVLEKGDSHFHGNDKENIINWIPSMAGMTVGGVNMGLVLFLLPV